MLHRIQWRFVIGYSLIVIAIMGVLGYQLTRPNCLSDVLCVRRSVFAGAFWLVGIGAVWGVFVLARLLHTVRQLTQLSQRIAAGDVEARMLPQHAGDLQELAVEFNRMKEQLVAEVVSLADQQQQMSLVVEYTADAVLIADEMSYVRLLNPAASLLLRIKPDESIGRAFAEVARHHQLIDLFQLCQSTQEREVQAIEIGRGVFLQAAITPFRKGEKRGYLIILQDMTAIHRLENVRRDFISNLSHELRTPLASLRAVVETLQDGALDEPVIAQRFLRRAVREVDTLAQMVEELLELSRIESGRVPLQLQNTTVLELILHPLERLRDQAARNELELVLDIASDLPRVLADGPRVQQVVTNLLHNAIKFTPPGGRICVRAYAVVENDGEAPDAHAESVIVEIKDNGIGISKPDIPRIFERFYKSDRARTRGQGGTGLGLAIARHLIEAHKGRIWVKSKEGKGSTFYFSLPVADGTET